MNNPDQRVSLFGQALRLNTMPTGTGYLIGSFWLTRDDNDPMLFEVGRLDLSKILPAFFHDPDPAVTDRPVSLDEALCLVAGLHLEDLEAEKMAA